MVGMENEVSQLGMNYITIAESWIIHSQTESTHQLTMTFLQ